ncbi:hypothetical protein SAMD00019534_054980 [Acytostelium subglobosum LB1]|uniref:hypothetical protein n=1 Tax=Acytostelium subglobosum LB1 TaxID=1410327 RepID=UPI000644D81F|nr:hypothetical protein SAMD00019534_054980 [Acytostelium subglobosum LB1]GAM22323.1 hypothetical protein SAMD00019534_054980 [Acytostelium subglobosum LB1]|eukprot:XP_012754443.1 hypothetical protein SAMD00019534_054980 [Acytostelium subglobosum LB1]
MTGKERVLYWPETYTNIKELGRGVSGVVYKAHSKESKDKVVAIKLVDINQSKATWDQVQIEINTLVTLNSCQQHTNIIKLIECFKHRTTAIFVLEYIDGGTLEDFMNTFDEGLPLPLVSHIIYQIISAIEYMNNRKCSHRDIKPANILMVSNRKKQSGVEELSNSGRSPSSRDMFSVFKKKHDNHYSYDPEDMPIIKVTDYGYASITKDDNDMHSTLAGSPLYMPPEVIHIILSPNLEPRRGKIVNDTNHEGYNPLLVDVWAIGAVAFRLITGRELINEIFPNLNQTTVLAALVNLAQMVDTNEFQKGLDTIPKIMKQCGINDPDCINFITSLLMLNPKERISLPNALNHPFMRAGKESFESMTKDQEQESKIPEDITSLTHPSSPKTRAQRDQQQQEQQQQQQQKDTQQTNEQPTTSSPQQQQNKEPQPPGTEEKPTGSPWSFPRLTSHGAPAMVLSPQRRINNIKLFPTLLPRPTETSPPQDTMVWRNPPQQPSHNIMWSNIAEDSFFIAQYGIITSIWNSLSSNTNYTYRIITQNITKTPLEIASSNHKESIIYMFDIARTVVKPQLVSLANSNNESSMHSALSSILQQLEQEQETLSFACGWTVLL